MLERDGDDLVVRGSLIDLKTQTQVSEFSNRYTLATLGAMPAAITGAVSVGLRLQGSSNVEALSPAATVSYDRGLRILTQHTQHLPEGIQLFEDAARLDPDSPLPLAVLVEAEVRSFRDANDPGLLTKAEKDLHAAESLNPASISVHLAPGRLNEAEGRYEQAKDQYVRVTEIEPRNVDGLIGIAGMYDKLDKPQKAVETYQNAIAIDPAYYEPYQYLGVFYYRRGRYDEAAEQFKKVTVLAPRMYVAYRNWAAALEKLDRNTEAEHALRASLAIEETPAGLDNMGTLLASQKRDAEAIPHYERSVAMNPHDYVALLNLADSQRRLGHVRDAEVEYRKGLDLAKSELSVNPREAGVRAFVAYFAVRLGHRERAADEIKQALQLSPSDSRVVLMAVLTYETLGKRNLALATLGSAAPQQLRELEREPDLADFSQDPRFRKLVDRKIKGGN